MSAVLNNITGTMDKVKGLLFNKKFLIIMVIVVIFLAVAFYVYNTYVAPKINPDFVPNREFVQDFSLTGPDKPLIPGAKKPDPNNPDEPTANPAELFFFCVKDTFHMRGRSSLQERKQSPCCRNCLK